MKLQPKLQIRVQGVRVQGSGGGMKRGVGIANWGFQIAK
jgi:hypothetical protein